MHNHACKTLKRLLRNMPLTLTCSDCLRWSAQYAERRQSLRQKMWYLPQSVTHKKWFSFSFICWSEIDRADHIPFEHGNKRNSLFWALKKDRKIHHQIINSFWLNIKRKSTSISCKQTWNKQTENVYHASLIAKLNMIYNALYTTSLHIYVTVFFILLFFSWTIFMWAMAYFLLIST